MQKLRYVIGLPVLETETGMQIGEIAEVIVDIEAAFVCGFIIAGENWLVSESIIAFEDLSSLGRDAMMVRNRHAIRQLNTLVLVNNKYYLQDLFDKQIFTDSGFRLGVLADILFDNITGEIKWYQVSDSIITDLLYGRMIMPLPQVQTIGQDKVIVPEGMTKLLHAETEIVDTQ
ncbi:MAG: PRC-barrel domain protein [Firmicutes bacterium]|nr:PRC-barrel domain protein [Bacillota bacterium]